MHEGLLHKTIQEINIISVTDWITVKCFLEKGKPHEVPENSFNETILKFSPQYKATNSPVQAKSTLTTEKGHIMKCALHSCISMLPGDSLAPRAPRSWW
jgi:hypothetical protein